MPRLASTRCACSSASHVYLQGDLISASPELSQDVIVTAAIDLVDEVGLDKFSVREIARRLDVFPTAIYWHVGSRSRLLSLAAGRLMAEIRTSSEPGAVWQDGLVELAHRIRDVMHRHPNFASIFGSQIGTDLAASLPLVEEILRALGSAGFSDESIISVYNAYAGTVLGWVSIELSKTAASVGRDVNWEATVAADLAGLDPERFPNSRRLAPDLANRAFMTRWTSGTRNPLDRSFEVLLRVLVAGIERELPARR